MARYIDADLIDLTKYKIGRSLATDWIDIEDVKRAIALTPTADVAPKSEVEELTYKLECLLCHATGGRLSKSTYPLKTMEVAVNDYIQECYDDAEAEATKEIAREIFEEIEKIIDEKYNRFVFKGQPYDSDEEINAIINYNDSVSDGIAELKKKYTEEKT